MNVKNKLLVVAFHIVGILVMLLAQCAFGLYAVYKVIDMMCKTIIDKWIEHSRINATCILILSASLLSFVWYWLNELAFTISDYLNMRNYDFGLFMISLFILLMIIAIKSANMNETKEE